MSLLLLISSMGQEAPEGLSINLSEDFNFSEGLPIQRMGSLVMSLSENLYIGEEYYSAMGTLGIIVPLDQI